MKKISVIILSILCLFTLTSCGLLEGAVELTTPLSFAENSDGTYSVSGCDESVTKVEIPSSFLGKPVTAIGDYAFRDCVPLQSVTIPNSIEKIGMEAFRGCTYLKSINIPDSVTIIDNSAFAGCINLTSIIIPSSVALVGWCVFENCSQLTDISFSCNSKTYEGNEISLLSLFYGGEPSEGIFYEFGGRTMNITIIDSTYIPEGVFMGFYDSSLNLYIPKTVTRIKGNAFYNCYALKNVYYEGSKDEWNNIEIEGGNDWLTDPDSVGMNVNIYYNYSK